ncbi:hypothetical protein [Plantactinospora sonchi]|uniref:Serine hydrolase n=1 Tax=Plantactinospora sonchi TaxID=1544735 RepID=A0ABU7RXH6_9ACTN
MRSRMPLVLAMATVVLGGLLLVPLAHAKLTPSNPPPDAPPTTEAPEKPVPAGITPAAPPAPTLVAGPVTVPDVDGFFSWALLDRRSGRISGARNMTATNSTESMIKVWIVSDYLRRLGDRKPPAEMLKAASTAIRDSNDNATELLFNQGGGGPVIDRLIKVCGLTDTKKVVPPRSRTVWWSYTRMSARDAVRMGECIKDGTAAGKRWTKWVLDEMTKVRGSTAKKDQKANQGGGRWGIIDGLPPELAKGVAIKNGWTRIGADGKWHLNCLAVSDDWVLSVLTRYPVNKSLDYGANLCASVASQLVAARPGAVLKIPPPIGNAAAKPGGGPS